MAIQAKTQKWYEGKSEGGGECNNPPPLLRERVKIENKPIYLRNWFKKGIVQVKHIMKNTPQFLSHSELQNRYDFHVCPLLYCGIISALKKLRKTITSVTTETTKITHKSLSTKICRSKSPCKIAYKTIINKKKEVLFNSQTKWLHDLLPHTTRPEINWKEVYFVAFPDNQKH